MKNPKRYLEVVKIEREKEQKLKDLIKQKIEFWQDSQVTTKELLDWAEKLYDEVLKGSRDFDDYVGEDSISKEVLVLLASLDMNLITTEDAPSIIRFLDAPPSSFVEAFTKLNEYLDKIDLGSRKKNLKSDPIYSRYC